MIPTLVAHAVLAFVAGFLCRGFANCERRADIVHFLVNAAAIGASPWAVQVVMGFWIWGAR